MSCSPFVVNNVDDGMKERILIGLKTSGADIRGNNPYKVDLNRGNIEIEAYWNPTSLDLEIRVVKKSFLISCEKIEQKLREEIEKSREGYDREEDFNFDALEP